MVEGRRKREIAWRIFAREFNSASAELPGEDQYAPTYLVTPLGAMINRIYLTGVLTECENVGTEPEPLWRGRVSDPTGVFYISAGQFQPTAARIMAELEPPALVGIVGKARTYSPDEGTLYVSVRVELVNQITQEIRDYWVLEACQSLNQRLSCIVEALNMEPPELQKLVALGYNKTIASGVLEAINQYGEINTQDYSELLVNTLNELALDTGTDRMTLSNGMSNIGDLEKEILNNDELLGSVSKKGVSSEKSETEEQKASEELHEQLIFDIINSLVEDNPEGVVYDEVQARAADHGLKNEMIEECIGSLIDKGMIYEPSIGVFKAV